VRLLIDANLSPKVAAALSKAGLESVHVGDVGLLTAPDRAILDYAAANALVIVSADSDFGELLAAARGATPSRGAGCESGRFQSFPPTDPRRSSSSFGTRS
jgi:predicted nuclease of predicted toxin-antitoxin system